MRSVNWYKSTCLSFQCTNWKIMSVHFDQKKKCMKIKLHYLFFTSVLKGCKCHLPQKTKQMKIKSCTYVDVQFKCDHKHDYCHLQITEKCWYNWWVDLKHHSVENSPDFVEVTSPDFKVCVFFGLISLFNNIQSTFLSLFCIWMSQQ